MKSQTNLLIRSLLLWQPGPRLLILGRCRRGHQTIAKHEVELFEAEKSRLLNLPLSGTIVRALISKPLRLMAFPVTGGRQQPVHQDHRLRRVGRGWRQRQTPDSHRPGMFSVAKLCDLVLPHQNPESIINVQMTLTSMVNTRYNNVTVTIDYTQTRQRQCPSKKSFIYLPSSFLDFFKYLI